MIDDSSIQPLPIEGLFMCVLKGRKIDLEGAKQPWRKLV
ncbi:hypothetical protein SAMN05444972_102265 [Marininema halotolerans]|uniref:Uncharacterized protein n=1 Tax=Marininema halotolerans TaxID=1155944 RepID=A0A1I6Q137_9BACL|nr:hypothetical protein SAMN05444972_102265 [Marininema halotolerans]